MLEGLPLAIELAAARVRVMPPRMLLARMSERFKLLASAGDRLDRQATLRAVFDWSWDLLSLPEKAALAQLSVFEGGFTLESVEAILDLSDLRRRAVAHGRAAIAGAEVPRQAGERRSLRSPDERAGVRVRAPAHARTLRWKWTGGDAGSRKATRRVFCGPRHEAATADSCADVDNFVAACRRAAARGDADVAASVLEGAWAALSLRGPFKVGFDLASAVLVTPGLAAPAVVRVRWIAGRALAASGNDADAHAQFVASLAQAREVGDRLCECRALIDLAARDSHAGRMDAARAHLETALLIAGEAKERTLQSDAHNGLGTMEVVLGRTGEARAQFEKALALAREARDREREGRILANLGVLHVTRGKHGRGPIGIAKQRWPWHARSGTGNWKATYAATSACCTRCREDSPRLSNNSRRRWPCARDLGHARLECIVLCNLGMVYDGLARFDEARDHFEAALAVAREFGDRHSEGQFLSYLGLLHARQANFDEARRCLDSSETLLRAVSDRTSLGILLCSRAETEHLATCRQAAATALAAAEAIAADVGAGPDSELGLALARVRVLLGHEEGTVRDCPMDT